MPVSRKPCQREVPLFVRRPLLLARNHIVSALPFSAYPTHFFSLSACHSPLLAGFLLGFSLSHFLAFCSLKRLQHKAYAIAIACAHPGCASALSAFCPPLQSRSPAVLGVDDTVGKRSLHCLETESPDRYAGLIHRGAILQANDPEQPLFIQITHPTQAGFFVSFFLTGPVTASGTVRPRSVRQSLAERGRVVFQFSYETLRARIMKVSRGGQARLYFFALLMLSVPSATTVQCRQVCMDGILCIVPSRIKQWSPTI